MSDESENKSSKNGNYMINKKRTVTMILLAFWIGATLSGCTVSKDVGGDQSAEESVVESEASADSVDDRQVVIDEENDSRSSDDADVDTQDFTADSADKDTDMSVDDQADTDGGEDRSEKADSQGDSTKSGSLYEKFLRNEIVATVTIESSQENEYYVPLLEKGSFYTFEQLGQRISEYFFDPEYSDKTSYDQVQYAYVNSADGAGAQKLLIKFVGLNIYAPDDDSYAVVVVSENDGKVYLTAEYECWARSEMTIYGNGIFSEYGSGGAGDLYGGISALLSDGTIDSVYGTEELYEWWTSYICYTYDVDQASDSDIYQEVFGTDTSPDALIVTVYTIGNDKYYQYDIGECAEEQKVLCETYLDRCHDELGINWSLDEEVETAIQGRCAGLGISYEETMQQPELAWHIL